LTVEEHLADTPLGDRQVLSRKAPLRDSRGNIVGILGVSLDITERKQAEEALQAQAEELQQINAELQQLAYVVSHDVSAPLRMIRYSVKKVRQDYKGELDAGSDELLGYAVEEAEWMQRLIEDLREYSRVHTRGRPFAPVDCEGMLERVLRQLAPDIERTDAQVTHDPLPTVMADEAQMVQLFQNLISNALKYRGEAPPRVHVGVEDVDSEWVFAVRDNGIGIDARHFERIFGIFERLHTREEYDGTGVGLAICQRIVQRHGGRIWVASEVGQGSTFYFTLPQVSS
jgi:light-regulated signal transduction histidine kinase (bacteriophytochrome)